MKKIKINEKMTYRGQTKLVGDLLWEMLEGVPAPEGKEAVRQIDLADDLKELMDKKAEWFSYEDENHARLERVLTEGAKLNAPRWIAPIQRAIEAAVSFKAEVPKEETKT